MQQSLLIQFCALDGMALCHPLLTVRGDAQLHAPASPCGSRVVAAEGEGPGGI